MAGNGHARLELYRRLGDVLGPDHAATLIQHWVTREEFSAGLDRIATEIKSELRAELHEALNTQTRTLMLGFVGANLAFAGLILGLT